MNATEDPFDTPEYAKFVESLVKHCYCCYICSDVPCDGVLSAGPCDRMCHCNEHDDPYLDSDEW